MQQPVVNPYIHCPTYETTRFTFRMVRLEDAQDLLDCYSDPASALLFNSDNCTSNFIYHTLEEMRACIQFWLDDYARRIYVRFSILDKSCQKAVGTIEFFARPDLSKDFGRVGLLRLDLASRYETKGHIAEIIQMVASDFYSCFQVDTIITKAVTTAAARICALESAGYRALPPNTIVPYPDYYVKVNH